LVASLFIAVVVALEFEINVLRTEGAMETFNLRPALFADERLGKGTVVTSRKADPVSGELGEFFGRRQGGLVLRNAEFGSRDEAA
jgi:hypothetical protein